MIYEEDGSDKILYTAGEGRKVIFLIGDSMRMVSCATTKEKLADVADVLFPEGNCRDTSNVIHRIKGWAQEFDGQNVDLVHFNCGQWDAAHFNQDPEPLTTLCEYERNIHIIIRNIRKFFPKAKIVMATTTPINPDFSTVENAGNPRTREDIINYNASAVRAAEEEGVLIDDLHAKMIDWPSEKFRDMCHFKPEAFEEMGILVAEFLRSVI